MPLDSQNGGNGQTFINILLGALNGLMIAVLGLSHFILRMYKRKIDLIENAHTEMLVQQADFVTRDDMQDYLRELEERLANNQRAFHTDNIDRLKGIESAVKESRIDTRDDISRLHSRIDEIKRGDDVRRGR